MSLIIKKDFSLSIFQMVGKNRQKLKDNTLICENYFNKKLIEALNYYIFLLFK